MNVFLVEERLEQKVIWKGIQKLCTQASKIMSVTFVAKKIKDNKLDEHMKRVHGIKIQHV